MNGHFFLCKAKTEANMKKNATPQFHLPIKSKTKAVIEPLLPSEVIHTNEFISYNRYTHTVKDGKKGQRYHQINYRVRQSLRRERIKIRPSTNAQFKSYIRDIPIRRTIKKGESPDLPLRKDLLFIIAFDNWITASCLAV